MAREQLAPEYVRSGKVRLVYRHLAILGEASVRAAVAAEAAADQGAFWAYHDRLFTLQTSGGQGDFTDARFEALARELGLDVARWQTAYRAPQTLDKVQIETRQGQQLGIRTTPTTFISGQRVEGAQPYTVFKALIDQRLAGAGT